MCVCVFFGHYNYAMGKMLNVLLSLSVITFVVDLVPTKVQNTHLRKRQKKRKKTNNQTMNEEIASERAKKNAPILKSNEWYAVLLLFTAQIFCVKRYIRRAMSREKSPKRSKLYSIHSVCECETFQQSGVRCTLETIILFNIHIFVKITQRT